MGDSTVHRKSASNVLRAVIFGGRRVALGEGEYTIVKHAFRVT